MSSESGPSQADMNLDATIRSAVPDWTLSMVTPRNTLAELLFLQEEWDVALGTTCSRATRNNCSIAVRRLFLQICCGEINVQRLACNDRCPGEVQ